MPNTVFDSREIYFDDPRLRMTVPGRLFVRAGIYIVYLVGVAAAASFIISDLGWLRALGAFLVLVLLDRLIHAGQADKPVSFMPASGRVNLTRYLRPPAFSVIERAFDKSLILGRNFFLEIINQCLSSREIKEGLTRLDVKPEEFRHKLEEILREKKLGEKLSKDSILKNAQVLVGAAFKQSLSAQNRFIGVDDIFSSLPDVEDPEVKRIFSIFEIKSGDLSRALILSAGRGGWGLRRPPAVLGGFVLGTGVRLRHRVMNRAWTARPTPTLDKYSADFTDLARQQRIGFLIGHEAEFGRMIETLARPMNPNVLLVGEAGIGKETLVTHLAARLVKDEVPQALFDKRLVSLDLTSLVAGAAPEELNLRLRKIVEEISAAGNVILYIPDIHNLVRTSGTAYLSAADALMPIIMNNAFPVVGATYPREFKELIEARSDFAGAFEVIRLQEVSPDDAEKVLAYDALILEKQLGLTISFGAIKKSVYLAKRYFINKFLPGSAEELLKSALVEAKRRGDKILGPDVVIHVAEEKTNVPIAKASEEETKSLLNLEEIIHRRLVDQEEAVRAISDALREYRSGLTRQGGPIAGFLFVGPTGVGKTELAKQLAKIQFGSESAMIRFDMTEYQDKQSFFRFIGSPDGKISGALTEAVLQKPYCLVLLDEFEKAFPDILNLFLQVLDDGRLTDNMGRLVDFSNSIIIATSNAHSDIINEALNKGQTMSEVAEYLKKKLVDVFRPELLNRFSRIVVFKDLNPSDLEKIVALNLNDLSALVSDKGITMEFDPAAVRMIVKMGYDPAFGARPLRRVIDEKLRAPLAKAILAGKISQGSKVRLVLQGESNFDFVKI